MAAWGPRTVTRNIKTERNTECPIMNSPPFFYRIQSSLSRMQDEASTGNIILKSAENELDVLVLLGISYARQLPEVSASGIITHTNLVLAILPYYSQEILILITSLLSATIFENENQNLQECRIDGTFVDCI